MYKLILIFFLFIVITGFSQNSSKWMDYVDFSKNGFISVINKSGPSINVTTIKEPYYDETFYSSNDGNNGLRHPIVYHKPTGKKILIWSDSKEKITNNEYTSIEQIGINTFKVCSDRNKCGVIDSAGNIILPLIYSDIQGIDPRTFYINESGEVQMSNYHLEVQLFKCLNYINSTNSQIIITRDGKVLIDETNVEIDVNYYINNKQIYSVFSIEKHIQTHGLKLEYKFAVSKLWNKPEYYFEGKYNGINNFKLDSNIFSETPLVQLISKKSLYQFFDFQNFKIISSIPPFEDYDELSSNYITTTIRDQNTSFAKRNVISRKFQVIVPFTDFESLRSFTWTHDEPHISIDDIQYQIDSDSLLYYKRAIKNVKGQVFEIFDGLYKINVGEVVPPIYHFITRISKHLCIVSNADGTQNLLNLMSFKKIFKVDFDKIQHINYGINNYLECTLDGKIEKINLTTLNF